MRLRLFVSCPRVHSWELWLGRWIHAYMRKCGVEVNRFVAGALINMYSRCGEGLERGGVKNT